MLCLDHCFATTIMPQPTEITQFIFGQPLRPVAHPDADHHRPLRKGQHDGGSAENSSDAFFARFHASFERRFEHLREGYVGRRYVGGSNRGKNTSINKFLNLIGGQLGDF